MADQLDGSALATASVTETQLATSFTTKVTNAYTSANLAYAKANTGIASSGNTTITGNITFSRGSSLLVNTTLSVSETIEKVNVSSTAFGSLLPLNFDVLVQPIFYSTSSSAGTGAINFRANSTTAFETLLANGQSMTLTALITNGSSANYISSVQIDSVTQTVKWAGGTVPTSGNPNSIDLYSFTLIKTAPLTYTVLGSTQKYA